MGAPCRSPIRRLAHKKLCLAVFRRVSIPFNIAIEDNTVHPFSMKCREPSHGSRTDAMAYHVIASDNHDIAGGFFD